MVWGYWLSNQCQGKLGVPLAATWSLGEMATKFGIALLSYANWSFIFPCHTFQVCFVIILHGHWFRSYIKKYGE